MGRPPETSMNPWISVSILLGTYNQAYQEITKIFDECNSINKTLKNYI